MTETDVEKFVDTLAKRAGRPGLGSATPPTMTPWYGRCLGEATLDSIVVPTGTNGLERHTRR